MVAKKRNVAGNTKSRTPRKPSPRQRQGSTGEAPEAQAAGFNEPGKSPGENKNSGAPVPLKLFDIREEEIFRGDGARGAAQSRSIDLTLYKPDDLIEVDLDNGTRLYTTFGQYLNDFPPEAPRGDAKPGEIRLPINIGAPGASRGIGSMVVKALKRIGLDPVQDGARYTAKQLADWYEKRQLQKGASGNGEQRLWRCETAPDQSFGLLNVESPSDIPVNKPVLLFLHGTASSTRGSFSTLWSADAVRAVRAALFTQYQDRVFGFEHFSLTQSPVENALDLLDALPAKAKLHLVSHSRGGMVGELLCRGQRRGSDPITVEDLDLAYGGCDEADKRQRDALLRLNAELKKKRITVERFIRVACPARGTRLADERLDRWLSVILNLLGHAIPPGLSDFYDVFKEFALAAIEQRTEPDQLPGLQAMMPDSALVKLLNAPNVVTDADLHVIAGDIEGGPWWKRLGIWVTDQFYDADHDLVVHTPAMYGGASRLTATPPAPAPNGDALTPTAMAAADAARFFFLRGEAVDHFSYFKRDETAQKLLDGLTKLPATDGYQSFDPTTKTRGLFDSVPPDLTVENISGTKPVVVLIPGIMGSQLKQGDDTVWVSPRLLLGGLARLAIDAANVAAAKPLDEPYGALLNFLLQTHDVVTFAFDWRLSLRTEAKRLSATIEQVLAKIQSNAGPNPQPVSILAHSMGGLLARVFIAEHDRVWQNMIAHRDARLIMLGTPNNGSHCICQLLTRREPLIDSLALADMKHSSREVIDLVKRFPGVLEMLPNYQSGMDFFALATWQQLAQEDSGRWSPPDAADLVQAGKTRDLLDSQIRDKLLPVERILYVAGCAEETPARLVRGVPPPPPHTGDDWPPPQPDGHLYFESGQGDGRVLWDSGIPAGVPVWYSRAVHGDLADTPKEFPAIVELLRRGTTTLLPQQASERGSRSATVQPRVMRTRKLERYPDATLLAQLAVGGGGKERPTEEPFRVHVAHGNLIYARFPVAVGHYQGDTIISGEALLDEQMGGRLSARRKLDLYPGPIGTCEVFLNPEGKFPGALVVGLGRVGELAPGTLTDTFVRGVLEYALTSIERAGIQPGGPRDEGDEPLAISLTTLLIGTTAGGLSTRDSLASLLRGVAGANRELKRNKSGVRVAQLEILELWQDRAIEATRLLAEFANDAELRKTFTSAGTVQTLRSGRERVSYDEPSGWWQRVQIVRSEAGELRFTRLTDRARAEVSLLPTQRGLVDSYIQQVTSDTVTKPKVAQTLFELLLPNELKDDAPDERDMVLVLDDYAAQYPWELLEDGMVRDRAGDFVPRERQMAEGNRPLAVRAGMIRQRMTEIYRPEPRLSLGKAALIVGNPRLDWDLFADLPAARAEAETVRQKLIDAGYEAPIIEADAAAIIQQLYAQPYRIIHLAGHGVYGFPCQGQATLGGQLESANFEGRRFRVTEEAEQAIEPWFRVGYAPGMSAEMPFSFEQGKLTSGMVIGRNVFLTPKEIGQMRAIPDLVFINCCYGGKDQAPARDRSRLAANLGTQLIEMGVKAVVAAGWEVDDAAARIFAEIFYASMLSGIAFGPAVHRARKAVYEEYQGNVNTWGAYQCYGDPDYRLTELASPRYEDDIKPFVAEAEAVAAVENLYQDALTARSENVDWLKKRLPKLAKAALAACPDSGKLLAILGRAYGELDMFDEAIEAYAATFSVEGADVDLRVVEQLANLRVRQAEALTRRPPVAESAAKSGAPKSGPQESPVSVPAKPIDLVNRAEAMLDRLIKLDDPLHRRPPRRDPPQKGDADTRRYYVGGPGETSERRALQGSLFKRRAMISLLGDKKARGISDSVRHDLQRMKAAYERAAQIQNEAKPKRAPDLYYQVQQAFALLLLANGQLKEPERGKLLAKLQASRAGAQTLQEQKRDFWTRANVADCLLAEALIKAELSATVNDIAAAYRNAQRRGVSLREWRSVVENVQFLRDFVARWPDAQREPAMEPLSRLYRAVEFFVDRGNVEAPLAERPASSRSSRSAHDRRTRIV